MHINLLFSSDLDYLLPLIKFYHISKKSCHGLLAQDELKVRLDFIIDKTIRSSSADLQLCVQRLLLGTLCVIYFSVYSTRLLRNRGANRGASRNSGPRLNSSRPSFVSCILSGSKTRNSKHFILFNRFLETPMSGNYPNTWPGAEEPLVGGGQLSNRKQDVSAFDLCLYSLIHRF